MHIIENTWTDAIYDNHSIVSIRLSTATSSAYLLEAAHRVCVAVAVFMQ